MAIIESKLRPIADVTTLTSILNSSNLADTVNASVTGGIPVTYLVTFGNTATGNVDITIAQRLRVLDCRVVKTGGAGGAADTVQVQTAAGAANITDAIDTNDADQVVSRSAQILSANNTVDAGGVIRVRRVNGGAGNSACEVYVFCLRVSAT